MIHHLFFLVANVIYDIAILFGPLALGYYAIHWGLCETIWDSKNWHYRFSLKYFLMTLGAIALLTTIWPENQKLVSRLYPQHTDASLEDMDE